MCLKLILHYGISVSRTIQRTEKPVPSPALVLLAGVSSAWPSSSHPSLHSCRSWPRETSLLLSSCFRGPLFSLLSSKQPFLHPHVTPSIVSWLRGDHSYRCCMKLLLRENWFYTIPWHAVPSLHFLPNAF